MKREAWIDWNREEKKWVIRLNLNGSWIVMKSWKIKNKDINPINGRPLKKYENILSEIEHLQNLGYEVKVTVSG